MRKVSEIKELPVLSIQDGTAVEKVGLVALNPVSRKVEYIAFAGAPWYEPPMVLHWSKIKAVGKDMITIRSRKDVIQVNDDLRRSLSRTVEISGHEVIDSCGRLMGRVSDLILDESTGEIRKIMLEEGVAVDISAVVTLGPSAVVVEAVEEPAPSFSESEFLLGKTVAQDICDEQGAVVVAAGTVVSLREIEAAKAAGALYDLVTGVK